MKKFFNIYKDEDGQSLILAAVALVAILCICALVIDMGSSYLAKSDLQNAADMAALAGAQDLPAAITAKATAINYAGKNGVSAGNVTVTAPYDGDSNKIEVVCTNSVTYTFAKIIGANGDVVSARAVAQKSGTLGAAFGYAIFSGDPSETLTLNGSSQYIGGSIHSNYKLVINGSSQTVTGSGEAVTSIKINGSSITVGGALMSASITTNGSNINIGSRIYTAAPMIDMPDFSAAVISQAQAAHHTYSGNKTFTGSNMTVDGSVYVQGDVTVNGSNFIGTGCILATGDITFNGSNLKNTTGDAVCFYSMNGDIKINGSSAGLCGIIYAPHGTIIFNGSSQTINGRIIGNEVNINGSSLHVVAGTEELTSVPSGSSYTLIE